MPASAQSIGSVRFRELFGTDYAYYAGAMYKGIASKEMVIALGQAKFLGFLGTGGLSRERVDADLAEIAATLGPGAPFGANLLHALGHPEIEEQMVDAFLRHGVRNVEASAFMSLTPAVVRYRCKGLTRMPDGSIDQPHRVIAKISRPEVAKVFMSPPPEKLLSKLIAEAAITSEEAELARRLPVASAVTVESDSGGHTDQGASFSQFPAIAAVNRRLQSEHHFAVAPLVGMAGGIGSPQAVAAAFVMGADYVVTGSINQCSVEAGTSDGVKSILEKLDIQDTTYAPAGDMFELGAKVQVVKKGTFFASRANKLFDLYQNHSSIDEIDPKVIRQLEEKYFQRPISEVWAETEAFYRRVAPEALARAETSPKAKMSLIFRWYFTHSSRLALSGDADGRVDYQIHCGPALGTFNQLVQGGALERWQDRHVADVALYLMQNAAERLNEFFSQNALSVPA